MSTDYFALTYGRTLTKESVLACPGISLSKEDGDAFSMTDGRGNCVWFDRHEGAVYCATRSGDNEPDYILAIVSKHCKVVWIDEYSFAELKSARYNATDKDEIDPDDYFSDDEQEDDDDDEQEDEEVASAHN